MGPKRPRPVVLDVGALIAVDRGDRRLVRLLELAGEVHVPAGVLAQAWRNPARQVRLARVVTADGVAVHPLDEAAARAVGQLCAASATADVVDASVVLVARMVGGVVVSADGDDLRRIDPRVDVVAC
ncbi:MAG: PIN domain-containing protein [Actinomycetota bacterium]|nr:PIN domain-containing protein [Actinomycetota bacterium]